MKTHTHIQDFLDEEHAWRVKEIADLKALVKRAQKDRQKTLIRAGVALLYAHWEGFIKIASEAYLNYISNQSHTYRELRTCFVVRGLRGYLEKSISRTSRNARINIEATDFIIENLDEKAKIPYRGQVATKSNLSSEVFESIAYSIGIDTGKYEMYYNFIDKQIRDNRNEIAHGSYVAENIDGATFLSWSDNIIGLLRLFKNDIENAIILSSYKRE